MIDFKVMAIFKRTALSFAVLLSLAPAFAQGNPSPRPIQAVRAGATRMDLSTYRSYYTNTGFNAFAVEAEAENAQAGNPHRVALDEFTRNVLPHLT